MPKGKKSTKSTSTKSTSKKKTGITKKKKVISAKQKTSKVKIEIKPSKQGTFTEYCKRKGFKGVTTECIREGLKSPSPAIRKKANFARNARKWNKGKK